MSGSGEAGPSGSGSGSGGSGSGGSGTGSASSYSSSSPPPSSSSDAAEAEGGDTFGALPSMGRRGPQRIGRRRMAGAGAPKAGDAVVGGASGRRVRRGSVSAEVVHLSNKPFTRVVNAKSEESRDWIIDHVRTLLLFRHLESDQLEIIADAMARVECAAGDNIITQGEHGEHFYLVETGEFDIFVDFKDGEPPKKVLTCGVGKAFGELALMYGAPRAATCTATADATLWALGRDVFNYVLLNTTNQKRTMYEKFLKEIPLFAEIDHADIARVADVLASKTFGDEEAIIKQGDVGECFYIVESGNAVARLAQDGITLDVATYAKGQYFGELALLSDKPRAASVVAQGSCKVVFLDKPAFTRLLGSVEDILRANASAYESYEQALQKKTGNTPRQSTAGGGWASDDDGDAGVGTSAGLPTPEVSIPEHVRDRFGDRNNAAYSPSAVLRLSPARTRLDGTRTGDGRSELDHLRMLKKHLKKVGRVMIGDNMGTIKYVGRTFFADGIWAGVELDEPSGRHDGCVRGVQYFVAKDGHGIMVKVDKITILRKPTVSPRSGSRSGSRSPFRITRINSPSVHAGENERWMSVQYRYRASHSFSLRF